MSEPTLVERLEQLKEWHIVTANNRVNLKKKANHTVMADTAVKSLDHIESQQATIDELEARIASCGLKTTKGLAKSRSCQIPPALKEKPE